MLAYRILNLSTVLMLLITGAVNGALIISQYVETDSGTAPKGIELWNPMPIEIDFSAENLTVLKGSNGGSLANDFTLTSGTLAPGGVMVIGTADIGTYLADNGLGGVQFSEEPFTFNGDDALQIALGGVVQDTFGLPGNDPGASWNGAGISTQNENIALRFGITDGDIDGWTDPGIRFETVSATPSGAGGLSGFGVAPTSVPEPPAFMLMVGAGLVSVALSRRATLSLTAVCGKFFRAKVKKAVDSR